MSANGSGNSNGDGAGSPWSRPSGDDGEPTWSIPPPASNSSTTPSSTARYANLGYTSSTQPWSAPTSSPEPSAVNTPDTVAAGNPDNPNTRRLMWFGLAGGGVLVIGVVLMVVLAGTGFFSGKSGTGFGPLGGGDKPSGPPLAEACPLPTSAAEPGPAEALPPGPRVTDAESGISYQLRGSPWRPWDRGVWGSGTLGVEYQTGYYFVTETYPRGNYLASVLSGKVPATVGDGLTLNLKCAGEQVAEDVRKSYYPTPNRKKVIRDEETKLGGRPAWVSIFHLEFSEEGLTARGERVAVVTIDVGRRDAAILYISIPDTHAQYYSQIDSIISSVRPT